MKTLREEIQEPWNRPELFLIETLNIDPTNTDLWNYLSANVELRIRDAVTWGDNLPSLRTEGTYLYERFETLVSTRVLKGPTISLLPAIRELYGWEITLFVAYLCFYTGVGKQFKPRMEILLSLEGTWGMYRSDQWIEQPLMPWDPNLQEALELGGLIAHHGDPRKVLRLYLTAQTANANQFLQIETKKLSRS